MDWYLDGEPAHVAHALRKEVVDYLRRHAEPGSDIDAAQLIVQEVVVNALDHTDGPVWASVSWLQDEPDLTVWDLGAGFVLPDRGLVPVGDDPFAENGRGLFLVTALSPAVEVGPRRSGGTQTTVRLPVRRSAAATFAPSPALPDPLPALSEAAPGGGFGREAFLRALVVQLSRAVERTAGPATGEDVVAQVGGTVGGQMELEYRLATEAVGRLTPQQIGECYVRLKQAIGGRFSVAEATPERIVLVNTACPFGDAVRRAPALCRMTSSVFGGIAARNSDGAAAVVLEERIAVGDPGCRVVVYLGGAPESASRFAHRYGEHRTDVTSQV